MFTGIIEETGKLVSISRSGSSAKVRIGCSKVLNGSNIGDSIAASGICLTAITLGNDYFDANISYETLERTSLKNITAGTIVNLERALTLSTRLGGHLVQGHVDDVAKVASVMKKGDSWVLKINYPSQLDRYITEKCSVCLDGISLTVTNVVNCSFEIAVIPHTFEETTLKYKKSGDIINIEVDQVARYIEKLLLIGGKDDKFLSLIKNMT